MDSEELKMPTVEELEAQIAAKNTELAEAKTKVTEYEEKLGKVPDIESFNQLKTDRDNLKSELKTLKDTIKKSGSDSDKEQLLAEKEQELERLNGELTTARAQAQKAETLEAEIVKELMSQLPDDENIKGLATGMEIPKLRLLVKTYSVAKPPHIHGGQANPNEIKLTDKQIKEAKEMFPFVAPEKQTEYYIHAKKIKGN